MKKIVTIIVAIGIVIMNIVSNDSIIYVKAEPQYTKENLQPHVIVERYYVKSGNVLPGNEFTIGVELRNTSKERAAYNILLTYASNENTIYPVNEEANQKYVEKIEPNEIKEVEINLDTKAEIKEMVADLELEIKYQDSSENNLSNISTIQIPVEKEPDLVVDNVTVSDEVEIGTKALISMQYNNNGIEKIRDLVMKIEGDFEEKQVEVELGNLSSMENKYLDYYVTFSEAGTKKIKITFQYTDSNGEMRELSGDEFNFKVNVVEKGENKDSENATEANNVKLNKIVSVVKILVVAVVTVAVLLLMKKKSEK